MSLLIHVISTYTPIGVCPLFMGLTPVVYSFLSINKGKIPMDVERALGGFPGVPVPSIAKAYHSYTLLQLIGLLINAMALK